MELLVEERAAWVVEEVRRLCFRAAIGFFVIIEAASLVPKFVPNMESRADGARPLPPDLGFGFLLWDSFSGF